MENGFVKDRRSKMQNLTWSFKVHKPHLLFCYGPCICQKLIHSFYKYVFQNMTWHICLTFNFVAVSLIKSIVSFSQSKFFLRTE